MVVAAVLFGVALVAGAVAAVTATLRSRRDPAAVVSLYLALLFLVPASLQVAGLGAAGTPAAVVGVGLASWWILGRISPALGFATGRQPVRIALLVFFGAMLVAYAAAYVRPLTGEEARSADRGLIGMLVFVGVALVLADGVATRARLETVLHRLVGFGAVTAVVGILQYVGLPNPISLLTHVPLLTDVENIDGLALRGGINRVRGTSGHAIEFGVVLAMLLPLAVHFAEHAREQAQRRRFVGAAIVMALALPMAISRSGIVAFAVALVVILPTWPWRRRLNAIAAALVYVLAARMAFPGLLGSLRDTFLNPDADGSISARTDDVELVEQLFRERPFFGRGLNTFTPEQYRLLDNQYYNAIIETGLVGVVAILALFVVGASVARGARRRSDDPAVRSLGQTLAGTIIAGAIAFATFDAWFYNIYTGLMAALIGAAGALWRIEYLRSRTPGDVDVATPSAPPTTVPDPAGTPRALVTEDRPAR